MDELNANTEGGASPSTTNVGAADAGGAGAQGSESSSQGQTTPGTPTEEFSAGWNFEDEEQPEGETAEGEDDDLKGMLADPNLDPARTPGLVETIRRERAEAKQQKAEIKRLTEENGRLSQNGYGLANDLIYKPQEAAFPFLQKLASEALPAYEALFHTFVQYEPDNLVEALRAAGKIPDAQVPQGPAQLTADDWARIPENLREVAKQVPADEMLRWLDNGTDESLLFNLNSYKGLLDAQKELGELKGAQKERAEKEWRQALQHAESAGQQSVESLTNQYEEAHYKELSKWQPFGPSDPQNQFLYRAVLEGAHATLLEDKQWRGMYEQATRNLQNAPLRRMQNDQLGADADERDARGLAARYNTRLGQVMKGFIRSIDSVFRDARAYREGQRKDIPSRTEIPGKSATVTSSNGVQRLTTDGKVSDAYMDDLMSRHGIPKR